MHMVFQTKEKEIAVIGVYINIADQPASNTNPKRALTRHSRRKDAASPPPKPNPPAAATPLLETLFASLPEITTPGSKTTTAPLSMSELVTLLKGNRFQTYSGSLTTPPCSEGVRWHVSTARLAVTPATFTRARDVLRFNARFPQNGPGEANVLMQAAAGAVEAAMMQGVEE